MLVGMLEHLRPLAESDGARTPKMFAGLRRNTWSTMTPWENVW